MLKAITLYEPWASLMAIGAKQNETRPMRTAHRGDIAIHAAKTDHGCPDDVAIAAVNAHTARGIPLRMDTFGCILAVVELWDVQPAGLFSVDTDRPGHIYISPEEWLFGNYAAGRFIYRCRNVRRLARPVPCRGYQSIGWTVPPDIEAQVRAQVDAAPRRNPGDEGVAATDEHR